MGFTSRFASQFDDERCIPVKHVKEQRGRLSNVRVLPVGAVYDRAQSFIPGVHD